MTEKVFERIVPVKFKGKRPAHATPTLARKLVARGMKVKDIAKEWGITKSQVYYIIKQQ